MAAFLALLKTVFLWIGPKPIMFILRMLLKLLGKKIEKKVNEK